MPWKKVCVSARRPHRPYASMNWIRFIGSLRCLAACRISAPCRDTPGEAMTLLSERVRVNHTPKWAVADVRSRQAWTH